MTYKVVFLTMRKQILDCVEHSTGAKHTIIKYSWMEGLNMVPPINRTFSNTCDKPHILSCGCHLSSHDQLPDATCQRTDLDLGWRITSIAFSNLGSTSLVMVISGVFALGVLQAGRPWGWSLKQCSTSRGSETNPV